MWYNIGSKFEGIEGRLDKLKQALENMKGQRISIHTQHKLFGKDNIKCDNFIPVIENGAGFQIGDQKIYIKYNDIVFYEIENHKIIINGNKYSIEMVKED